MDSQRLQNCTHVLTMEAGWRIEMLIEQHVLGGTPSWVTRVLPAGTTERRIMVPAYSRDMNLAMMISERAELFDDTDHLFGRCVYSGLWYYERPGLARIHAATPSLVLCRAALILAGVSEVCEVAGFPVARSAEVAPVVPVAAAG